MAIQNNHTMYSYYKWKANSFYIMYNNHIIYHSVGLLLCYLNITVRIPTE